MENTNITTPTTIEHFVAIMVASKERLLELCGMSARAYTDPDFTPTYADISKEAAGLVERFNWASNQAEFLKCAESEDPMRAVVERFTRLNASIRDKKEDVGGGEVHSLALDISEKQIDLLRFAKYFNEKYGANIGKGDWYSAIQQLGLQLTLKTAAGIGEDVRKFDASYNMTKLAREFKLAKEDETGSTPNPVSKNQMIKTIDLILTLMLGEGGCDSRDAYYLGQVYAKKSKKALSLKAMNNRQLVGLMHEIAHRVCLGLPFSLDAYTKKS